MENINQMFKIGKSVFQIESSLPIQWEKDFREFQRNIEKKNKKYTTKYNLIAVGEFPHMGINPVAETEIRRVYRVANLEIREYLEANSQQRYVLSIEKENENKVDILLDCKFPEILDGNRFFFNYFSLEKHLLKDNQIILHSCYVIYEGRAILFTAPSGTGKSTQGELWRKYKGAEVINGDRALIGKENGVWMAYGIPFSGTSGICINRAAPIEAIVCLEQYPVDEMRSILGMEAFKKLYGEITMNHWNKEFTEKACAILEDIVKEVPIYHLKCTKEKSAVLKLDNAIH